jgi:hypothetical protein
VLGLLSGLFLSLLLLLGLRRPSASSTGPVCVGRMALRGRVLLQLPTLQ